MTNNTTCTISDKAIGVSKNKEVSKFTKMATDALKMLLAFNQAVAFDGLVLTPSALDVRQDLHYVVSDYNMLAEVRTPVK